MPRTRRCWRSCAGFPTTTAPRTSCVGVYNLSRFAQPVELMLGHMAGKTPVELLGRVPFPPIGELPYFVTLPPYDFFWFDLVETREP